MKGKIILPVVLCLILLLVGCGKEKVADSKPYMATLDINPAIELEIEGDKANRINYLSGEAEELVSRDFEGKSLNEIFDEVLKNAKEKGLIEKDELTVIVGLEENPSGKDQKMIQDYLQEACDRNNIHVDILIPEITEEAKHEAQGYNITPAKAAVILEATKGKENVHLEDFTERTAKELKEIKETGLYCEGDYTLRDGKCEKPIREENPTEGKSCPENYQKYKDKCYKVSPSMHEPSCKKDMELVEGKCVGKEEVAATPKCSTGTYNSKTKKCEVIEYAGEGTKTCREKEDLLLENGKCASHHMGAHFDDPSATIDPATECCCGDTYKNGWCYSLPNGNYDATVKCPSGQTAKDGKCYRSTTSAPTYTCSKGTLEGSKCIVETTKEPTLKISCAEGYISYEDRACLNPKDIGEFIIGLTCPSEARLENGKCVYYEVVDAR